jgi:hypothetical protein
MARLAHKTGAIRTVVASHASGSATGHSTCSMGGPMTLSKIAITPSSEAEPIACILTRGEAEGRLDVE